MKYSKKEIEKAMYDKKHKESEKVMKNKAIIEMAIRMRGK